MTPMSRPLTYLASPYTAGGVDHYARERRFFAACKAAAVMMQRGNSIFCPIAHSVAVEDYGMDTPEGHAFWMAQDYSVLAHCAEMFVLTLPGWEESIGVAEEIAFCNRYSIPVYYLDPVDYILTEHPQARFCNMAAA